MKSLHITIGVPVLAALCGVLIGMAMTTDPTWSAVPCDAQAGQMQPRKLNRLDIIERRLDKIEEKLGRIVFAEDIERALKENWIAIDAEAHE